MGVTTSQASTKPCQMHLPMDRGFSSTNTAVEAAAEVSMAAAQLQ